MMPFNRTIIALLLLAVAAIASAAEWPGAAKVVKVIDGDTIVVTLSTGQQAHVRIVGIDTPEFARHGKPTQPGAEAANRANERFCGAHHKSL